MTYPNPIDELCRWLETPPHGITSLFNILGDDLERWPKAIALVLGHYLEQSGYNRPHTDLANTIGGWQEPERNTPYHPQLVKDWLKGNQLISNEAFEGILSYLQDTNTISESTAEAFSALRSAAETHLKKNHKYCMDETTQTARAMVRASTLTHLFIGKKLGISAPNVNFNLTGYHKFAIKYIQPLDALLANNGQFGFLSGHIRRNCEQSAQAFDSADSFGHKLNALRLHFDMGQKMLGASIGVTDASICHWEKETVMPDSTQPYCPTSETIQKIITWVVTQEEKLEEKFREDYTPLLTPDRITAFTAAANTLRGDRNTYERIVLIKNPITSLGAVKRSVVPDKYPDRER